MKRCFKCKLLLDKSNFYKDKSAKDGLNYYCKDCEGERLKKYRKNHREKVKEINREYRKNNLEKYRESSREYRENNPEKVKEHQRKWRENNPEKARECKRNWRKENFDYFKNWHKENPEKRREYNKKRKLKELQLSEDFTPDEKQLKREKTKGFCQACGKYVGVDKLVGDHEPAIDVAPVGYVYTIDDIRFLCGSCNRRKWKHNYDDWIKTVKKKDPIEVYL